MIDQLENDSRRSLSLAPPSTGGYGVDLTGIHDDIDRLQDRMDDIQVEISNLGGESPEIVNYQNLGFKNLEQANAWNEENCPHRKYGLIVDFHIMMEHVEQKIKGSML